MKRKKKYMYKKVCFQSVDTTNRLWECIKSVLTEYNGNPDKRMRRKEKKSVERKNEGEGGKSQNFQAAFENCNLHFWMMKAPATCDKGV
jgi:hypothetical protein